jgi:glutathione S-transferase
VSGIIWEKIIKQHIGETTNEERVKELITQLESKLDGYEAILSRQKYLAGNVRSRNVPKRCRPDELLV